MPVCFVMCVFVSVCVFLHVILSADLVFSVDLVCQCYHYLICKQMQPHTPLTPTSPLPLTAESKQRPRLHATPHMLVILFANEFSLPQNPPCQPHRQNNAPNYTQPHAAFLHVSAAALPAQGSLPLLPAASSASVCVRVCVCVNVHTVNPHMNAHAESAAPALLCAHTRTHTHTAGHTYTHAHLL